MVCLSSARKTELQNKITRYETLLDSAVTAYGSAISGGTKRYRFDAGGGEASQMAERIDNEQLMNDIIKLQAWVDYYNNQLNGLGIINMALRRDAQAIICGS